MNVAKALPQRAARRGAGVLQGFPLNCRQDRPLNCGAMGVLRIGAKEGKGAWGLAGERAPQRQECFSSRLLALPWEECIFLLWHRSVGTGRGREKEGEGETTTQARSLERCLTVSTLSRSGGNRMVHHVGCWSLRMQLLP
jgi:hypothetical protein